MKILFTLISLLTAIINFSYASNVTNSLTIGKTFKVAGSNFTSLNRIDGSFEASTASWSASVGTITQTASTEFQGNYKGVWAGTGTGTLDLQWTATASNTYEASALFRSPVADSDHYVCAVVNGIETGCKIIDGTSYTAGKIIKISVVADSVMSTSFYLRLKHTGSDAFSVEVDDGRIEPYTFPSASLNINESISFVGYSSKSGSNIKFKTLDTARSTYGVLSTYDNSTYTKFSILRPSNCSLSFSNNGGASASNYITHYDSTGTIVKSSLIANSSGGYGAEPLVTKANTGDYFIATSSGTPVDDTNAHFSIICSATSDYIFQSWQDGTEWTSYTPTFSAGFGTVTNPAGKWKRSGSDLEVFVSGTVGTLAASIATVSLPTGIDIDSNKLTINNTTSNAGNLVGTYNFASAAAGQIGNVVVAPATSTNLFYFGTADGGSSSHLTPSNGNSLGGSSVVFSFYAKVPIKSWSSLPTLLPLPASTQTEYTIEAVGNAGQAITANVTDIPFIINTASSTMASSWSGSVFTAPISGNYEISGSMAFTTTQQTNIVIFVNGVSLKSINVTPNTSTGAFSGKVYLSVGQQMSLRVGTSPTLLNSSTFHTLSITRLNGKNDQVMISNLTPDTFIQMAGVINPVRFVVNYGTTNISTVCSGTPCYIDQIGNAVTSITRTALGKYTMTLNKTYSKLKCTGNATADNGGTGSTHMSVGALSCSNCNGGNFFSANPTASAFQDSFGTISCDAIP